mgnify:CR=1 FL=1|tara:strand:+ start:17102 stop:17455 length:354 start_codon:yes stop_codon:yes gene_type:complete
MKAKTILCDIDGTLLQHYNIGISEQVTQRPSLLDGSIQKINEWDKAGYNLILITGRRESQRKATEEHLSKIGIVYDQLIMGVGGGDRILINDKKPNGTDTAFSYNVDRNYGVGDLDI